jgi:hypothetical protein
VPVQQRRSGLTNLANVKHLIAQFDAHLPQAGQLSRIDQLVLDATRGDPSTFSDYQGFTGGNGEQTRAFIGASELEKLAGRSEFSGVLLKNSPLVVLNCCLAGQASNFGGYLRDPQGNKIALFSNDPDEPGREGYPECPKVIGGLNNPD